MPAGLCKSETSEPLINGVPPKVRIGGIASTEALDHKGDVIFNKVLDLSYLLSGQGFFNWNHQKSPDAFIGGIDPDKLTRSPFYVEGPLFMDMPVAQDCYRLMRSMEVHGKQMGLSVEGGMLRDKKGAIVYAKIVNVTVDPNPVNTDSLATLMKSWTLETADPDRLESLEKALSVGYSTDSTTSTSGGPIRKESMIKTVTIEEAVNILVDRCPFISKDTAANLLRRRESIRRRKP